MMEIEQLVIIAVLLVLLAEVTYLVTKLPRASNNKKKMIFVDTSVLIDSRILAVAKSGFVGDTLVIPRSVIGELQFLADHADHEKRARARHGLDVVKELQEMAEVDVTILQDGSKAEEGVDERLLKLAKKHSGAVCTIDYNLNKVAVVEGIQVLNVNELAQSLRMAYLPGEKMLLELVQKGQDSHQGVGYLTDGTMVVVEQASKNIGQTVEIEFIRSLQTAAGKMMFAKLAKQPVTTHPVQKVSKPVGRRVPQPVRPSGPVEPKAEPVIAKAYHSDANERRQRPPKDVSKNANPRPQQSKTGQARSRTARPMSSAQREASLINLVDKQ